jgi:hypothetical protein
LDEGKADEGCGSRVRLAAGEILEREGEARSAGWEEEVGGKLGKSSNDTLFKSMFSKSMFSNPVLLGLVNDHFFGMREKKESRVKVESVGLVVRNRFSSNTTS